MAQAQPIAGHSAVASVALLKQVSVVTQNVDDLHERAGSVDVLHLHDSLFKSRCAACAHPAVLQPPGNTETGQERVSPPRCTRCLGYVRPGVVWFGENLPQEVWEQAKKAVEKCYMLIMVGTSGVVYPAAGLVNTTASLGKFVLEINPTSSELQSAVSISW